MVRAVLVIKHIKRELPYKKGRYNRIYEEATSTQPEPRRVLHMVGFADGSIYCLVQNHVKGINDRNSNIMSSRNSPRTPLYVRISAAKHIMDDADQKRSTRDSRGLVQVDSSQLTNLSVRTSYPVEFPAKPTV